MQAYMQADTGLEVQGEYFSLSDILEVSRLGHHVYLSDSPEFLTRLER
jgi:hypothetical protein